MGYPDGVRSTILSGNDGHDRADSETIREADDDENISEDLFEEKTLVLESQDMRVFPSLQIERIGAQLTRLNLNYNRLSKLPNDMCVLAPNLKSFSASGNELSALPDNFGALVYLEELFICENNLVFLPESLCNLTNLRVLKASGNSLKRLYSEIGQNISLEILNVEENNLKRFPSTLGLLQNLRNLEANCNKLESLPSTLDYLKNLRTIDLSKNRIQQLPDSFGELTNLQYIDLSENLIRSLCPQCKSTASLERIYMDGNFISSLPQWFCDLERVVEITLKSNDLTRGGLPEGFGNKSSFLKILDLRGNFLEYLPNSFVYLAALEILLLGTPFDYLERNPHFINGNWLGQLPCNFSQLTSLRKLQLEENQLRSLPEDIGCLNKLEDLLLGSNMLFELPESFTLLTSMKRCKLSKNQLRKLPSDFGALVSLEELYLDTNKLRSLPESMKSLSHLKVLDLTENRLKDVPTDIIEALTELKALSMFSNKFEVPDTEIPHISKKTHYAELNSDLKDNWRGRNNRPGVSRESEWISVSVEDSTQQEDDEEGEDAANVLDSSEEEEDWDKELEQSTPSLTSTERRSPEDANCDDWELELSPPSFSVNSLGIECGQFDLCDEDSLAHRATQRTSPLLFDYYGNPSRPFDLTIQRHRLCPYILHAPRVPRFSHDGGSIVEGQFDSGEDEHEDEHACDSVNE